MRRFFFDDSLRNVLARVLIDFCNCFLFFFQGDEHDEILKSAYRALMTIRVYEPNNQEYIDFQREIADRVLKDYNLTFEPGNEV